MVSLTSPEGRNPQQKEPNMYENLSMHDAIAIAHIFRKTEAEVRKAALSNQFEYDLFGTGYIDTMTFLAWVIK